MKGKAIVNDRSAGVSLPMIVKQFSLATIALSACLWAGQGSAAPLSPSLQSRLDVAVLAYESGRWTEARAAFSALARQQVPAAHHNLAVMHLRGEVPQPSVATARRLLTQAARAGFVTSQFTLAQGLETGRFGRLEIELAMRWYEVAALGGSVAAQVEIGTAYYLGRGRPKDPALALRWFREGARGGDIGAMYLLASMYEHGEGVPSDLRLARYWYGVAAEQGDEAAPGKVKELDARAAARGALTTPL